LVFLDTTDLPTSGLTLLQYDFLALSELGHMKHIVNI
jgi:hypothetical protein